jgi:ubiquinone biosynthesis protein UbiJ
MEMLVTAGIETLLNQLLKADANSTLRLQSLRGKVLQVNIAELPKPLYFIFSSQIDVLAKFDAEPDCCMDIKLTALPRLHDSSQFTALIKEGELDMRGDPMVASKFSMILKELEIDWEEHLSRYTGDIAAHKLFQTAQSGQAWLQNNVLIARQNMAEYLIEEIRLAPGALEIADFCDEVSELEQYCKQLEMRLARLSRKEDV